jgi:ribosomal protein S8
MLPRKELANALSIIQNGITQNRKSVFVKRNKNVTFMLELLVKQGFIGSYTNVYKGNKWQFEIELNYFDNKKVIGGFRLIDRQRFPHYTNLNLCKSAKNHYFFFSTVYGVFFSDALYNKFLTCGGTFLFFVRRPFEPMSTDLHRHATT